MADKDNRLNGASRLSFPINRNDKLGKSDLEDLFRVNLSTSSAKSSLSLGVSNIKRGANFDVELYKFNLPDNQVLKSIGKTEFRKIKGGVLRSNLQLIAASRLGGNKNEAINSSDLVDGSYVIRVLRKQGDSRYRLTGAAEILTPSPNPNPNPDPNPNPNPTPSDPLNSITTAPDITIPNAAITGRVGDTDTQDFYKITPTTSGDYLFDLSGASGDANFEVIASNQTTALKRSTNAGNDKAIVPLTAGSTYYFHVFQAAAGNNTNYSLGVTQLTDAYSGSFSNGLGSATPLTLTSTSQVLSNYVVDQGVNSPEDLFTFNVSTTQGFVSLELTNMPIGNLGIQLFKAGESPSQGLTLDRPRNPDGSYPSELIAGRVTTGQYYVRVIPNSSSEGSTYSLSLKITDKSGQPAISRDISFGSGDSNPKNITAVGSLAYFSASDSEGTALYRTDGTLDGTQKIRSFSSLKNFATVGTGVNARLYFVADDGPTGEELWTTDGISATKVIDLFGGIGGGSPRQLAVADNTLYFLGSPGSTSTALYRVVGTTVTMLARGDDSITNPDGSTSNATVITGLNNLTGIGSTLYFSGSTDVPQGLGTRNTGNELFTITNSQSTPTLTELKGGSAASNPSNFVLVGGKLFATAVVDGPSSKQLVRIDALGDTPSYAVVRSSATDNLTFTNNQKLQYTVTDNGTFYFTAIGDNEGAELFKLDNPAAAPSGGFLDTGAVIKDIVSDPFVGSDPTNLVHIGNTVYFFANDNTSGKELWSTNGTSAGTNIVKDIQGGTLNGVGDTAELVAFGGKLYFTANDGIQGTELWESDGSSAGTTLKEINGTPAEGADPNQLTVVDTNLFFAATDGLNGQELWSI